MDESSTKSLAEGREAGVPFAVGLPFAASCGPWHAGQGRRGRVRGTGDAGPGTSLVRGRAETAVHRVRAGGAPCPAPPHPAADPAFGVAVATSPLAAGAGPVGTGVTRVSRADGPAVARRAGLHAAERAGSHGARLKAPVTEGRAVPMWPDARPTRAAPPLGAAGHARRHPGAERAASVAHGATLAAPPDGTPGVPAFAGRLGPGGVDAGPARVKSRRPAGIRVRQAALDPGGARVLNAPMQASARPLSTGGPPSPPRPTPPEPVRHEPIRRAVSATGTSDTRG